MCACPSVDKEIFTRRMYMHMLECELDIAYQEFCYHGYQTVGSFKVSKCVCVCCVCVCISSFSPIYFFPESGLSFGRGVLLKRRGQGHRTHLGLYHVCD